MSFFQQIATRSQSINSLLCIGLDPHLKELNLPESNTEEERAEAAYQFCKRIIDATHPHAVAYKPNAAFFEALGTKLGCVTLRKVVDAIPDGIPVLLDVKRGDIGSTAAAYAEACYDDGHGIKADGVTLSPLMGWDSVQPFVTGTSYIYWLLIFVPKEIIAMPGLCGYETRNGILSSMIIIIYLLLLIKLGSLWRQYFITKITETIIWHMPLYSIQYFIKVLTSCGLIIFASNVSSGKYADKGAFILCKTSNPGSNDLLALSLQQNQTTLFEKIAALANEWSQKAESETPSSTTDSQNAPPRLGLVVGATDPQALAAARKAAGQNVWILAPGVGAQGGDLDAACKAGLNSEGSGMLIPVSRGVSRASDPGAEAQKLKEGINAARAAVLQSNEESCSKKQKTEQTIAPYQKEFLEFSLSEGVLKFGSFVLKSGRTSPYFFNAGLFSSGSALHKLGRSYAASIMASEL